MSQEGDTLIAVDRGDFFTQDDGREHLACTAYQWEYEDGAVGSGRWVPLQPFGPHDFKRSPWDERLPSEDRQRLQIGQEWIGRRFRLQTWAGYGPSADSGQTWVEWGNSDGSHSNDLVPSARSYSEPWTVKPFSTPDPVRPPLVDTAANLRDALKYLGSSIETWKRSARYQRSDGPEWLLRQRQTVMHRVGTLPQDYDTLDTINSVLDVLEDERS